MTSSDHDQIVQLVGQVGDWVDNERWDTVSSLYTAEALVNAAGGTAYGLAAIVELAKVSHQRFAATEHAVERVDVEINGDSAVVSADLKATFTLAGMEPDTTQTATVHYDYVVVRTPSGWRFTEATITPIQAS